MFQTKVVENFKTLLVYSVFFLTENRVHCERMWKNMVQFDRS